MLSRECICEGILQKIDKRKSLSPPSSHLSKRKNERDSIGCGLARTTDHTHRWGADSSDSDGGVSGEEELADSEAGTPAGASGEPHLHEILLIHPLAVCRHS